MRYETRCKTGRTSAKVHATKSRRNFSQRTYQAHPIRPPNRCVGAFRNIWVFFGPFICLTKLGAKRAQKCKSSTLNWCFSVFCTIWVHLGPFGLRYETRCKTGRTSAKVHATKSRRNFSQRTYQVHPIRPPNRCVGAFRTIWVFFGPFICLTKLGAKRAEKCKSSTLN